LKITVVCNSPPPFAIPPRFLALCLAVFGIAKHFLVLCGTEVRVELNSGAMEIVGINGRRESAQLRRKTDIFHTRTMARTSAAMCAYIFSSELDLWPYTPNIFV
jgi:hypothetical protein